MDSESFLFLLSSFLSFRIVESAVENHIRQITLIGKAHCSLLCQLFAFCKNFKSKMRKWMFVPLALVVILNQKSRLFLLFIQIECIKKCVVQVKYERVIARRLQHFMDFSSLALYACKWLLFHFAIRLNQWNFRSTYLAAHFLNNFIFVFESACPLFSDNLYQNVELP